MIETIEKPIDLTACCTLDIDGVEQVRLVKMFKALGNPTRFEIMKFLLTHPQSITGDIVDHLPLAQATVSQHLKVLREAGWIASENQCQATCSWLDEENIAWFREKVGLIF
jgi:DNA-binding transcriptional ArsR family regulator